MNESKSHAGSVRIACGFSQATNSSRNSAIRTMEQMLINAAGTLAFGGGGIAIVAYFAHLQFKIQSENHQSALKRVCDSFDRALDRRDSDIEVLANEVRFMRSGMNNNG